MLKPWGNSPLDADDYACPQGTAGASRDHKKYSSPTSLFV